MRFLPTRASRDEVQSCDPGLDLSPVVLLPSERVLLQKMQDGSVAEVRLEATPWTADDAALLDGEMAGLGGGMVALKVSGAVYRARLPETLRLEVGRKVAVPFGMASVPCRLTFGDPDRELAGA